MRYIKIYGGTGICGTDFEEYMEVSDETTDEELYELAQDMANDNASMYESSDLDEDDYDTFEEYEDAMAQESADFWADVCGSWEEVSEEEYLENKED